MSYHNQENTHNYYSSYLQSWSHGHRSDQFFNFLFHNSPPPHWPHQHVLLQIASFFRFSDLELNGISSTRSLPHLKSITSLFFLIALTFLFPLFSLIVSYFFMTLKILVLMNEQMNSSPQNLPLTSYQSKHP